MVAAAHFRATCTVWAGLAELKYDGRHVIGIELAT
ncbi:MAG: hypothetical protein JWN04_3228, partial [Myxococcaceae bacterium]|nr:hypothetical protein [Myxococcaceae bacterium]